MRSYRLLFLDKNGRLTGNTTVDCSDDQEAIAVAEWKVRKCEYIEVWDGGRPVCTCARSPKRSVRLARLFRYLRLALRTRPSAPLLRSNTWDAFGRLRN
jgi:hypothetical protein